MNYNNNKLYYIIDISPDKTNNSTIINYNINE